MTTQAADRKTPPIAVVPPMCNTTIQRSPMEQYAVQTSSVVQQQQVSQKPKRKPVSKVHKYAGEKYPLGDVQEAKTETSNYNLAPTQKKATQPVKYSQYVLVKPLGTVYDFEEEEKVEYNVDEEQIDPLVYVQEAKTETSNYSLAPTQKKANDLVYKIIFKDGTWDINKVSSKPTRQPIITAQTLTEEEKEQESCDVIEKNESSSSSSSNSKSSSSHRGSIDKQRRDKKSSSSSSKSSSSSSSKVKYSDNKKKEKSSLTPKSKDKLQPSQAEVPLVKVTPSSSSLDKRGKIPKKPKDMAVLSNKPISITMPSKKASMSMEFGKDTDKSKTVKTHKSQFRSHGLTEEAPPPPPSSPSSLKRTSPLPLDLPPEKKLKIDINNVTVANEKPGAIRLIPYKKVQTLVDANPFSDDFAAAIGHKNVNKRKRRTTVNGKEVPESSTTFEAPKVMALNFYQDTVDENEHFNKNLKRRNPIELDDVPPHPEGNQSKQRKIQADHELTNLKALYSHRSLIPDSPPKIEIDLIYDNEVPLKIFADSEGDPDTAMDGPPKTGDIFIYGTRCLEGPHGPQMNNGAKASNSGRAFFPDSSAEAENVPLFNYYDTFTFPDDLMVNLCDLTDFTSIPFPELGGTDGLGPNNFGRMDSERSDLVKQLLDIVENL